MAETAPLKILIAEDNDSDRLILQTIIRKQGHEVVTARDGEEAVAAFGRERPQLVLLDALMPHMDGMEAAQHIKQLAGEALVPIIFLTSLSDAEALAKCLEAGGDDFLSKPYNRIILEAKIKAFNRMRLMHETVQEQRDLIQERNRQLLHEQQLARGVFDNIAHSGCLNAENIRYLISPMSIFNGDVLFASPKPSGGLHLFLGDFTGHGLPAAIGAMPLAEIFYGMTAKGFGIADILHEANQKLQRILPTGLFCCGAMVDVNLHTRQVEVWNGGLPDGCLVRLDGTWEPLKSRHLPLGVVGPERFSAACERYTLEQGERVLFCSDGILEARDATGEMFGEARFQAVLDRCEKPAEVFDTLTGAVQSFVGKHDSEDDLTVVEVAVVPEETLEEARQPTKEVIAGPRDWQLTYELTGETLREFNPIPLLLQICMDVPGLRVHSGTVYTILTELFSNALEHGILGLPSNWKDSPEGFSRYYGERERRLRQLVGHYLRFELSHKPTTEGGILVVTVEDSGSGFDYTGKKEEATDTMRLSGRGIGLLKALCHSVQWEGSGNRATAEYHWAHAE
ncbi:fused response regulator/phosphatase [Marinobacteraceae bacterium S3BR75-40.1]